MSERKTSAEAKQEAIKAAYGEHWEKIKDHTTSTGWVQRKITSRVTTNGMEYEKFGYKRDELEVLAFTADGKYSWRLRSLSGIDDNQGWTRIEPDGSNLPERDKAYNVIAYDGRDYGAYLTRAGNWLNNKYSGDLSRLTNVTHYKPIIEEPKPLY